MGQPVTRATVLVDAGDDAVEAIFRAWLAGAQVHLTFVSGDVGCGCCVHLFELEGSAEVIASLPKELRGESAWSEPGVLDRQAAIRSANGRADMHRDAADAFREHRYSEVVRVLAQFEDDLSGTQRAKLEYARRHVSAPACPPSSRPRPTLSKAREWWKKLTRRRSRRPQGRQTLSGIRVGRRTGEVSKEAHIVYCRSRMLLDRAEYGSWWDIQDAHDDYTTSLGPCSEAEIIWFLADDWGADDSQWPFTRQAIADFFRSGEVLLVCQETEPGAREPGRSSLGKDPAT